MNTSDTQFSSIDLEVIAIKGDLVTAKLDVPSDRFNNLNYDIVDYEAYVKQHLAQILARQLLESKQIYFSKLDNHHSFTKSYMARVCVVPKDITQEIVKTVKNTRVKL